MQLTIETKAIEFFSKQSEFSTINKLKCFVKEEHSFCLYFFSFNTETQAELLEKYIIVRDFIAIYFQSDYIDKEVERWNLYTFFFIREKVNIEIKYKIEQDKFSSRKIVIDDWANESDYEEIKKRIELELFSISIENPQEYNETKIDSILKGNHRDVFSHITKNSKQRTYENDVNKLIEELGIE
jgi:hypothetical protein